jgi:protein-tyrosine phosphatase
MVVVDSASPYRIVFVCMGNICRSPTAEVVFAKLLDDAGLADKVTIASAGTGNWHVGDGMDKRARKTLAEAGYDGSRHRAQQFVADWFEHYDLIVAMDRQNRWFLEELAPDADGKAKIRMLMSYDPTARARGELDVPDPYYEDNFADVLALVERGCQGLLAEVRAQLAA